ncbi:unnamed protein product [Durusdinium trenchii]|uniref:Uncharacterized protein n=1 Tax=Durusdinium trenchii TaxID=1381693 RepID=A0ABP0NAL7_9DINO
MFLELMFVCLFRSYHSTHPLGNRANCENRQPFGGPRVCSWSGQSGRLPSLAPSPVSEAMCPSCFPGAKEAAIHGTGKGGAFIQQGAVSDVTSALFFEFQLSEKTEESVSTRARTVVTREIVSL